MKKRIVFLIAWSALMAGCSTPGMKELKAYCEKDAGVWIDERVYTNGYFYNFQGSNRENVYLNIVFDGYEYIEIYKEDYGVSDVLLDRGYFKLFRAEKGNPLCNQNYQRIIEKQNSVFNEEYCVAVEKINYPESRYWQQLKRKSIEIDNKEGSSITRFESVVLDKKRNKKISRLVKYTLYPTPNDPLWYGTSIPCNQGKHFPKEIQYNSAIKPIQ